MVTVIRCPSESQLREVTSTYHNGVALVGEVHENLCTLASLRILISGIVDRGIVTDVLKMLSDGLGNGYLHLRNTQRLHQRSGIVVRAVRGAETWHRDTDYSFAVQSQLVECAHADQQGQRRIQTTADAQYHMFHVGV